ncbi:MAG: trypsin-like peptidase domain-containing protein [Gammaproteobacteria bacterium]|nr:trypsin-like peptidase domain-containing protein [Gammaproteobacteria bacterium]
MVFSRSYLSLPVVIFVLGWLLTLPLSLQAADSGLPGTVKRIKPSVVGVGTYMPTRRPRDSFKGTGFVVSNGQYVITNEHVVSVALNEGRREVLAVYVKNNGKTERREAELVARDPKHDLALLSIKGAPLKPMKLGNDKKVREGALYAFSGYPIGMLLGLTTVTHRGIVSAITPIVIPAISSKELSIKQVRRMRDPYNVFQLDAVAYPGNSGSPLYEPDTGRVVGVINSVFVKDTKETLLSSPSGIAYAIPVRYVKELLKQASVRQ